jgi:mannosyltransferase OCH1-like enzyme
MIPRTLCYCWFGGGEKPARIQQCLASYALCPGYTIVELNDTTWDVDQYPYTRDAYAMGKWAFVADVARLDWLFRHGGITLDADIEILKPLDRFLAHRAFTSRETAGRWISAVIAAEPAHPWIDAILDYYRTHDFVFDPATIANTVIIDRINRARYSHDDGETIYLTDGVAIYPRESFEAKDWSRGHYAITEDTYTVHHYEGSWLL